MKACFVFRLFLLSFGVNALSLNANPNSEPAANASCPLVSLDARTNIWAKYNLHPNAFRRHQVLAAAAVISDDLLNKQARKIADVGSFYWLDNTTNMQKVEEILPEVPCANIVGLVLQGIQDRNCTREGFSVPDHERYQRSYGDPLATLIRAYPRTAFAIIIEPGTLPAIINNPNVSSCQALAKSYRQNVAYALNALKLPNAITYIDAGHGGSLGRDVLLQPAAEELAAVYKAAAYPSQLRGIAVNIGGWNSWDARPGEFETPYEEPASKRNRAHNEKIFSQLLGRALDKLGVPSNAIVDTSRNGVIGLRYEWEDWCNVDGAGFGVRPSVVPGLGEQHADAFVWAKAGGVSDGTSDPSSVTFDPFCGRRDAFSPSPEAGEWNQAYFEMLLRNARPVIAVDT
ncbi:exoglucanase-6A [Podospora didyma]|uniref:Glucanase n=1 Tax=Podospora didyma TaxID=330526 RepID=A0AAE0U101_9PEZI|nr:exoglucanase-6A [Podospora didyma]